MPCGSTTLWIRICSRASENAENFFKQVRGGLLSAENERQVSAVYISGPESGENGLYHAVILWKSAIDMAAFSMVSYLEFTESEGWL